MHENALDDAIVDDDFVDISAYVRFFGLTPVVLVTRELWDRCIDFDDHEFVAQAKGGAEERLFDVLFGVTTAWQDKGGLSLHDVLSYSVSIVTAADLTEEFHLEAMLDMSDDEEQPTLIITMAEND